MDQKFIINAVVDTQVNFIRDYLINKNLLYSDKCEFCKSIKKEVGGFFPKGGKIAFYCDDPSCRARAYFSFMKKNGNGSPTPKEF